jgi:hypothetical protein
MKVQERNKWLKYLKKIKIYLKELDKKKVHIMLNKWKNKENMFKKLFH